MGKIMNYATEWEFKLGEEVEDTITKFKGMVTARIEYLNGCRQYCVEPPVDKDGKLNKSEYVDGSQLEVVDESEEGPRRETTSVSPGGKMRNTPET